MRPNALLTPEAAEVVVSRKTGEVRQAGASASGDFVKKYRKLAEANFYFFARAILNCHWLTPTLHKPICDWLQRVPPRRKMLIIPRGHGKTTLVGQCLPMHMWIQPLGGNYLPKLPGASTRIIMAGETISRAQDHLRVVKHHMMSNEVLRGLWPHLMWENDLEARRKAKWNESEMIVRRPEEYPDPSMRAIGVDGAITGAHPNVLIKDDLTTEAAANSPLVMQTAIDWHINSRALLSNPATDLEFITGTRWAAVDLPGYVMDHDATVDVNSKWRGMIEDGKPIYPEQFGAEGVIESLMKEFGVRFPLLYMNSIADSQLVDFDVSDLRFYELRNDVLIFDEDERDAANAQAMNRRLEPPKGPVAPMARSMYDSRMQEERRKQFIRRDRYA